MDSNLGAYDQLVRIIIGVAAGSSNSSRDCRNCVAARKTHSTFGRPFDMHDYGECSHGRGDD
jgi:hypothetical protein